MVLAPPESSTYDKKQICEDIQVSLSHHPNILLDCSDTELIDLDSLHDLLTSAGVLPTEVAVEVMTKIAHSLSHIHSFQLTVGNNLTLESIYIDGQGEVKLFVPSSVFENAIELFEDQWPVNVSAQSQYGQMCGPLQEKLEDDIRKLADVFWQVLNGFEVDPLMELEDWASSEKVLTGVAVELLSVRSLLFRMLRAGFPGGYRDMQSVVIDLWELGVVSFPSKQNTRRATTT